ncbi:MAG: hypothetical protein II823_05830 [Kiritimatiellae bacterium]|nr:hypothetical protein [Kiritimatiellia bacterium]
MGSPCGSVPDFILPDTSGLTPLELPAEFTAFSRKPQTAPSESAISRFQNAMESAEKPCAEAVAKPLDAPHPSEDRRFFANTIVSVEPHIIETQVEAPVAVEKKPTFVVAEPVTFVASNQVADVEGKTVAVEPKPVVVVPEKPVAVTPEKTIVLPDDKSAVVVTVERPAELVVDKPAAPVAPETPVLVERPDEVVVDKPIVSVIAEKPVIVPTEKPEVAAAAVTVEPARSKSVAVSLDQPTDNTIDKSLVETDKPVVPVVVERPATPGVVEKSAVAIAVEGPAVVVADDPVPLSVEKPVDTPPDKSAAAPTEQPAPIASAKPEPGIKLEIMPAVNSDPKSEYKPAVEPDDGLVAEKPVVLHAAVLPEVAVAAPSVPQPNSDMAVASARTVEIVAAVEEVVAAVSEQIVVTPSLVKGEGEVVIKLKPTVLDGSELKISAKDNALSVVIAPSTPQVAQLTTAAIPQLERALAEHMPTFAFINVAVAKKGKLDETK